MVLERLKRAGVEPRQSHVECLGAGDCVPGVLACGATRRRWCCGGGARSRRAVVERFTKEFAPLVTSGPPGVTGYTTGRPAVREVFAYWPALVPSERSTAAVQGVGSGRERDHGRRRPLRLRDIAHGRSGDKGNHANVAMIAYTERVSPGCGGTHCRGGGPLFRSAAAPAGACGTRQRTCWRSISCSYDVLAGGASRSLRSDTQGKTLALALLQMPLRLEEPSWHAAALPEDEG